MSKFTEPCKSGCLSALLLSLVLATGCQSDYPETIHLEGGRLHIQGLALDKSEKCLYSSFTSTFFKSDLEGQTLGSITGINGHLGAMTFDDKTDKVYASLEIKNDAIGRSISDVLGKERHSDSAAGFYVAEIDVTKVQGMDVPFDEAVTLHKLDEVVKDYRDSIEVNGKVLGHRYGCSGIDGIAIAPEFGSRGGKKYLYVAYGIYGDTTRPDNDYNVLLCYDFNDLTTPIHKYFIKTGNTTYGVQNMCYDKDSDKLYLAVYKGKKEEYPNYSLFALDMKQKPFMAKLDGVPYEEGEFEQVKVTEASHFPYGSTGLYSFGDGRWYVSIKGSKDGVQYSDVTLYNSLKE